MNNDTFDSLVSYVETLNPIIYINHFDFVMIDSKITEVGEEIGGRVKYIEFNNALGIVDFKTKRKMLECDLVKFLNFALDDVFNDETYDEIYIVLKDVHSELNNPKVIALMKRISELVLDEHRDCQATIFIVSEVMFIPRELENYITIFDIPLPNADEILELVSEYTSKELKISVEKEVVDEISFACKGLSEFQIKQILRLAFNDSGSINREDKILVLREKEQLIKKSGMLDLVEFSETIDDIGGLENLKDWLLRKEKVFANLEKALRFGVDMPKGVMIIGIPGCGKSLTAKATASLFNVPLVRLDVGRLLGKYVGESEENMRKALKLSEAISPCVLWIDEIEKAFSGVGGNDGGNGVTTRLFGQLLTWMQEKESSVFIVATANDISGIPPEFLRKGRFDEVFSVDLPNDDERKRILDIHLRKRKKWNKDINLNDIVQKTEKFSGADLEAAIKVAIETAFINDKEAITTEDLLKSVEDIEPVSKTLGDEIEKMQECIEKMRVRKASKPKSTTTSSVEDEMKLERTTHL